ncbi:MAG: energy transducer TonB, partial [Rhodospirillales bacterium]
HPPKHSVGAPIKPSQSSVSRETATPDDETAALLPDKGPDTLRQPVPVKGVSYTTGRSGNLPPEYPKRARRRGYEGRVLIRAIVTPMGVVDSTEIVQSSGHDILDRAAIRAVRRWRFTPATRDGKTVVGTIDVPISFWLNQHTAQGEDKL